MQRIIGIISCIMIAVLCIGSIALPAVETYTYAEEGAVQTYAENYIQFQVNNDVTDKWTNETIISETIYTYDTNGYINGYIFNLTTNDKESGYIVVETLDYNMMNIVAFGHSEKYYLTNEEIFPKTAGRALINAGLGEMYYKKGNAYYDPMTGSETALTEADLAEAAAESITITQEMKAEKESTLMTLATTSYVEEAKLPGIESFKPWSWFKFASLRDENGTLSDRDCGVIAAMNMMKYWADCTSVRASDLFLTTCSADVYNEMATYLAVSSNIRESINASTDSSTAYKNLKNYLSSYGKRAPVGMDYKSSSMIDYTWLKTQFQNGNAVWFSLSPGADPDYTTEDRGHAMLGVGMYADPYNNYIRVAHGGLVTTDSYMVYAYKKIDAAWYYRWA